jgi:hypothetical protein
MEKETTQGNEITPWHIAFFEAIQMELDEYRRDLQFIYQHPLTTEPLRIDVVIIKKSRDVTIEKNIASIFRKENIVEYKSPDDYLAVKDFLKVYAYANLYAAITPGVDFADITLTFVENRHPRKLLKYLVETRGYTAEETSPGIYLVSGDYLPIQIIESGKLPEQENMWLSFMAKGLKAGSLNSILDEVDKRGNKAQLGAYFAVLLRANSKAFLEGINMARSKLPTLEEVLTEAGLIPEWIERGRVQGLEQGLEVAARNAIVKGLPIDVIHDITGLDIETIKQLAINN